MFVISWRLKEFCLFAGVLTGLILPIGISEVKSSELGKYGRELLASVNQRVEQRKVGDSSSSVEFVKTSILMSQIQSIVSPRKYSELSASGKGLPVTVEDCLESKAGICGNQVACFLALAEHLKLRARPVEFYLHGDEPSVNSSHIGVEVQFSGDWRFFDITWGTFFRRKGNILSISQVLKMGTDARRWAITNELDQWYLHWKNAGLDPLVYVDHPRMDMLRGRQGNIRIFPVDSNYTPVHQPAYVGLNSLHKDYGPLGITLKDIPFASMSFAMEVTGVAGDGVLVIAQKDKVYRVKIESMKIGNNRFELPFQFHAGDIKIAIQQRNPRRIGYLVYSTIEFQ
ncbi:MAG: transglutaminase domain-containing protein [Planctomycetota bacterium]|nr:transglutaminase domain-containing protein [Planctomycetota bacterium]